ncbi:hypothetical protein HU200_020908 [Digitaria exilis]|uniref:Glycosyltransferase 61 catalytic domain-containing protein n=1 Tax=Digitaria exilis TaxID=1010633 RepID=A0A835F0K5_9POAL|nr:hypothetical protein HU200_020908 [Digitaria exilis]CAB3472467.1 unnamed protein product [Digitaria exilis]
MLIIARRGTRKLLNLRQVAATSRALGFDVTISDARGNLKGFATMVNSCDVLLAVHGAGLTNQIFLPVQAVVIQIVPWGKMDWMATNFYGEPARGMNLRYLEYHISEQESSLAQRYPRDHMVFKDPMAIHVDKMSFSVRRRSPPALVVPSGPTPTGELIPLTSMDKARLFSSFTSLHVFAGGATSIHDPAETIRRAISAALVHYYPVAGRIVTLGPSAGDDDDHDFRLACTGDGVLFAAATASCTLRDARFFLNAPPHADLALRYGTCSVSDPLLLVQVTEFACGGYAVAATWNHGVADGFGMAQLLRAVGELARGLSPSVKPVRHDESIPDVPQHLLAAVLRRRTHAEVFKPVEYAYCDITIPRSFIDRVKAEWRCAHAGDVRPCTEFEAVTAAIWRCRTRAIGAGADDEAPAPLVFAANIRRHVGAKEGYYGNCLTAQLVTAASGSVASGGGAVVDLVRLIRDAKERIQAEVVAGGEGSGSRRETVALGEELVTALCGYNALYVSSWGGLGMDGVDFGDGPPVRVLPSKERVGAPACYPCLPRRRKDDDDDASIAVATCVTEEHVDEFMLQLSRLR